MSSVPFRNSRRKQKAIDAFTKAREWRESDKDWKSRVRKEIRQRDGNNCFYCNYAFNADFPPTIEHLLSVAAGGSDHVSNLVLACEVCNKAVGDWELIRKIKFREFKHKSKI